MDLAGGSSDIFPMDPILPNSFGVHFLSHITSFVDNSRYLYVPGSMAIQEALNFASKFSSALLFWFASGPNSCTSHKIGSSSQGSYPRNCKANQVGRIMANRHNVMEFCFKRKFKGKCAIPVIFGEISRFTLKRLCSEAYHGQSFPALSLAAALIPPMNNFSLDLLAAPLETGVRMDESQCEVQGHGCGDLALENFCWTTHVVEPRTGIKFPTILDNIEADEKTSSFASEVLVGTGSRIMKILKIKSLKVYAFGFYIHPPDIHEKLGPKYASIPLDELKKCSKFYEDLLREDIGMSVRLVVSCNGIKINTVKNAFEKSLRARLVKANPDTDYHCLKAFGSLFSQDIPLQVGTTIYFQRTTGGDFITKIGSNHIGAVHSKDLCRAFFDMYIGDPPVCEQTKEEIRKNVGSIMRRS